MIRKWRSRVLWRRERSSELTVGNRAPFELFVLEVSGVVLDDLADVVLAQELHGWITHLLDRVDVAKKPQQRLDFSLVRDRLHLGTHSKAVDRGGAVRFELLEVILEGGRERAELGDLGIVTLDLSVWREVGHQFVGPAHFQMLVTVFVQLGKLLSEQEVFLHAG